MTRTEELKGFQKTYLKKLAHNLKPSAYVGQKGLTGSLIKEIDAALESAELIKVKFVDFKEKEMKKEMIRRICERTGARTAGIIGHVAIYYRPSRDEQRRKIKLPE